MRALIVVSILAAALASSACKSESKTIKKDQVTAPDSNTGTSGTRLKIRSIKADDGATMALGFYDSDLDLNCSFRTTADGLKHCVPDAPYFVVGTHWADAQCTTSPLTVLGVGCAPPPYFYKGDASCGVENAVQVFRSAAPHTGKVYVGSGPSDCHLGASTWGNDPTQIGLVALGDEVPASDFVAGDEVKN